MVELLNQIFGNRKVISERCTESDWQRLGMKVPKRKDKYKLTQCLNCGAILPSMYKNLIEQPPKRCVFCSNIGNHNNVSVNTNSWTVYDDYAVCNVMYNGQVVSFYIDASDYEEVRKKTWRVSKKRQKYYIVSGSFKKRTGVYLHELVIHKEKDEREVDHIDGNSLNNRKNNLRLVSRQENIDNQRATRIDNKIGIRGVSYDKKAKSYVVDCSYHGTRYYMKNWKTIEEAVWCRRCFEEYFGLNAINHNPLASQYYTLPERERDLINDYVKDKILGNKR